MLILSRKKDEKIEVIVDGKILATVMLVDIRGPRARIGFQADESVKFVRSELLGSRNDNANAVQLHGSEPATSETDRPGPERQRDAAGG